MCFRIKSRRVLKCKGGRRACDNSFVGGYVGVERCDKDGVEKILVSDEGNKGFEVAVNVFGEVVSRAVAIRDNWATRNVGLCSLAKKIIIQNTKLKIEKGGTWR